MREVKTPARQGDWEEKLHPTELTQEFMVREGNESVIYIELSTIALPSPAK